MDKCKEVIVGKKELNCVITNEEIKRFAKTEINEINIKSKQKGILAYISLVKILSAFLVILKHTNRFYWEFNDYWISNNILSSFCMCAVPLFHLCIGATLLNYNERYDIKEYWKRRFNKVIIPIIGWNIVYYFYRVYFLKDFKLAKINLISLYELYFNNQLYPIIASLRTFIFGYMIIPLIAHVPKINKIPVYTYCFIALLINQSIIPYCFTFIRNHQLNWPYNYNTGLIIYVFAGFIIHNQKFGKKFKFFIYMSGNIGLFMRLYIAHYLTLKYKKVDRTQINYQNLPIVLYSCSVFLFIKENYIHLLRIININYINKIGSLSMGPFFLHYMIIWGFHHLYNMNENTFNYRFFGAFIITMICFVITWIIKKIPLIRYLTP